MRSQANRNLKRRLHASVTMALAIVFWSGCSSLPTPDPMDTTAWSSKDASVLGRNQSSPQLSVGRADLDADVGASLYPMSIDVLLQAVNSTNPLLRANAIEGLRDAGPRLSEAVRRGLADENRGVRFVAAMMVGKQKLSELTLLLEPLLQDSSLSVQAAAIYGLKQNGVQVNLTPLAEMIRSDNPEVKGNAALILGELGDSSAIPLLQQAIATGLERASAARARLIDMQIAEALVKLGVEDELQGIRANLFAPPEQGELTALACQISARLDDKRVIGNLMNLATRTGPRQQSPEVRMAASMALAQLEPTRGSVDVAMLFVNDARSDLRSQAAMTLGIIGHESSLPTLAVLLNDKNPIVQVTAAAAILRIVPDPATVPESEFG